MTLGAFRTSPVRTSARARAGLRAAALAAGTGAAALLLSGCGAGQDATIYQVQAPYDGTRATVGDLVINNTVLVLGDGQATFVASVYNGGSGQDKLTGITTDQGTVQLSGDTTVPASGGELQLGVPSGPSAATTGGTRATASISSPKFKAGQTVKLTMHFEKAGDVSYYTIVYPAKDYYADVVGGTPAPTSTESMTPSPSTSPTTSLSATPSAVPISPSAS